MTATYKALSALLSYPTAELQKEAGEIRAILEDDRLLPATTKGTLASLLGEFGEGDLLDLQSRYVDLFDRSRSLSLYLFEHVHGESRDRGQAMVDLRERYRVAGFDIATNELPDYLPLFLEYLSLCPAGEAKATLAEAAHVLRALSERLKSRGSNYAAVFEALEALTQEAPNPILLAEMRRAEIDNPNDLAALDRAWEEAEVRFGPSDAQDGCPRATNVLSSLQKSAEVRP